MANKIYYQEDCNLDALKGKKIAIIGYGSQGHAHALNLKESGLDVIVGLRKDSKSWKKAEEQGLTVFETAEAAKQADVIMILTPDEKQAVLDNSDIMEKLGFSVSELGEREIAVREIPTYLGTNGVSDAVLEIANSLLENRESVTFEAREWLMHSSACRAAIKAGHVAPHQEMVALAEKILCGSIPKFCPHGRPVYFTMTKSEIEKRFGRIV